MCICSNVVSLCKCLTRFLYILQAGVSVTEPCPLQFPVENQEQPSPISVLEPPFQEDDFEEPELSDNSSEVRNGNILKPYRSASIYQSTSCLLTVSFYQTGLDLHVHRNSNFLDKSPPIGSVARTLLWNDSCTDDASPCPIKSSSVPVGPEEERQELVFLVQTLLTAAKLGNEMQSETFFASWHSLESPLDPSLRDNYVGLNDETMHETKLRHRKSVQKLVFDCVNAALVELAVCGSDPSKSRIHYNLQDNKSILDCLLSLIHI